MDSTLEYNFCNLCKGKYGRSAPANNNEDGEYLPRGRKLSDFFESNCKDSYDCHVQAIEECPALDEMKTYCSNKDHEQYKQDRFPHLPINITLGARAKSTFFMKAFPKP